MDHVVQRLLQRSRVLDYRVSKSQKVECCSPTDETGPMDKVHVPDRHVYMYLSPHHPTHTRQDAVGCLTYRRPPGTVPKVGTHTPHSH